MSNDTHWQQLLELSVALEIAKHERDSLRAQTDMLKTQLEQATRRAEKAEDRLHETTSMLWTLSRDAISMPNRSMATEVMVDGKSVLRLSNPVSHFSDMHGSLRSPQ